jgi:hypothetical protein
MEITSPPTLINVVNALREDIFSSLQCHAVGKIEEFNELEQIATVSIEYQRQVENNPDTFERADYPNLIDIPVIVLGGGNGSIRFPIKAGDNCLVLFNDRDLDGWFTTGSKGPLSSDRKHSFCDGVALVGIRSMADSFDDYDPDRTELVHNKLKVSLKDKLRIKNDASDLYAILDGVLGILSALQTTNAVPGSPSFISPAQASQVTLFKTQLSLLMES